MEKRTGQWQILLAMTALAMSGCEENELLKNMAAAQSAQNRQVLELQQEITEGTRRLVLADTEARQELLTWQRELQAEWSLLGEQREQWLQEVQTQARQQVTHPVIAQAIIQLVLLVICCLPLLLCWQLLRIPETGAVEQEVLEQLLQSLTESDHSWRLPQSAGTQNRLEE